MSAKSISNLAIIISADTAGASKGIDQVIGKVREFNREVGRGTGGGGGIGVAGIAGGALGSLFGGKIGGVGGMLGGMIGGPAGAAIGAAAGTAIDSTLGAIGSAIRAGATGLSEAVKEIVKVGADYEMALAVFTAATGSESSGKSILKALQGLAAGTIFSSEQLANQARVLMGYGIEADNVVASMTKLALIAQKTGRGEQGLDRLVLAFGQVRQANRLFGTELRQFTEAGVGVGEFAKTMGVSAAYFRDLVETGAVGFDVVAKTINRLGMEAETQAEAINRSFWGSWNSVKDVALQVFGEIGLEMIRAFQLPGTLQKVASYLQSLPEKVKELVPYLQNARQLAEPIATGLYAGGTAMVEAARSFVTIMMPSMKDAQGFSKSIGETLAVGMGTAVDFAIDFGINLAKAFKLAALYVENLQSSPLFKFFQSMESIGRWVPNNPLAWNNYAKQLGIGTGTGNPESPAGKAAAEMLAGLQTLKSNAGKGGFAAQASNTFKAGLPEIKGFKPSFDQSGTAIGEPALPGAVRDLAKSINEMSASGKGMLPPLVEFQQFFRNLQMAEGAGLVNRQAADAKLYAEWKQLTGNLNKQAVELPAAMDRYTVEGQRQIERVIANMRGTGQNDVPGLLRQLNDVSKQQLDQQKRTVDELRRLVPNTAASF